MAKGKIGKGVSRVSVLVVSQPSLRYEGLGAGEVLGVLHCCCSTSYKVSSCGNLKVKTFMIKVSSFTLRSNLISTDDDIPINDSAGSQG